MSDFQPTATVIADSVSDTGIRLTTMQLTVHQWILPRIVAYHGFHVTEQDTRSRSLEDAITVATINPVYPSLWAAERDGTQTSKPLPSASFDIVRNRWDQSRAAAVAQARHLALLGAHRSICLRLLEPFSTVTLVVSSTCFDVFFRQHAVPQDPYAPLAEHEINVVSRRMHDALNDSEPEKISPGQWHTPYLSDWETENLGLSQALQTSATRCLSTDWKAEIDTRRDVLYRVHYTEPARFNVLEHIATPARPVETVIGTYTNWVPLNINRLTA